MNILTPKKTKKKRKGKKGKGKTYKEKMMGKTHQRIKRNYGMKAFNKDGTIKPSFKRKDLADTKKKYKKNPTDANLKQMREAQQSVNWMG